MRVVPLVVSALGCAGCDAIWDLEHVDEPTPLTCANPVGHDEDGDTLDDACDPCPFSGENDGDDDADGLANLCDPDPGTKNELLLFTGFAPSMRTQLTIIDGNYDADAFHTTSAGAQSLLWNHDADDIWVIAGMQVSPVTAGIYREAGLVLDATTPQGSPNGTACVLGMNPDGTRYIELFARHQPGGSDAPINGTDNPPVVLSGFTGIVRASYDRSEVPAASCTFSDGAREATITGTQMPAPATGSLALYALNTDVVFTFLLVATKP